MTVRLKIMSKEIKIGETILNMKKTFQMQKTFLELQDKIDGDNPVESINSTLKLVDAMSEYVADVAKDKAITVEKIQDTLEYLELIELTTGIINGVLHITDEDKKTAVEEPKNA